MVWSEKQVVLLAKHCPASFSLPFLPASVAGQSNAYAASLTGLFLFPNLAVQRTCSHEKNITTLVTHVCNAGIICMCQRAFGMTMFEPVSQYTKLNRLMLKYCGGKRWSRHEGNRNHSCKQCLCPKALRGKYKKHSVETWHHKQTIQKKRTKHVPEL